MEHLSAAEARRLVLAAQGFAEPRPPAPAARARLLRTVARLGLLQIDSVNVLVRAQYLPLFSRLGPYGRDLLDHAAAAGPRRALFEYWGHEASLLPVGLHPLLRWRMARAERGVGIYRGLARWARGRRGFIERVLAEVAARGPLAASELTSGRRRGGGWWAWSDAKRALEWLFWAGRLTTAARRRFERVYDLPERALPAAVLGAPVPPEAEAQRALLRIAARALGVATGRDLADYFRLPRTEARLRLAELVEAGDLLPGRVEGWGRPAFLDPRARMPGRVGARALLAPFDPLIWERERAERLFGFHYRIAIYTPATERRHGYYVLPFLLGDRLVARVDLKADRAAGVLRVPAAHAEPSADPRRVAAALAAELGEMASWLGLGGIAVAGRGDLARPLRAALGREPRRSERAVTGPRGRRPTRRSGSC